MRESNVEVTGLGMSVVRARSAATAQHRCKRFNLRPATIIQNIGEMGIGHGLTAEERCLAWFPWACAAPHFASPASPGRGSRCVCDLVHPTHRGRFDPPSASKFNDAGPAGSTGAGTGNLLRCQPRLGSRYRGGLQYTPRAPSLGLRPVCALPDAIGRRDRP